MHLTRMAAKAAIERALNELARFFEREQARQDVKAAIKREQTFFIISSGFIW
jgi:folate-dependent phosphoribosylglycinamide formyltransferase PurN